MSIRVIGIIEARSIKESKSVEAFFEANKHLIIEATKYRASSISASKSIEAKRGATKHPIFQATEYRSAEQASDIEVSSMEESETSKS